MDPRFTTISENYATAHVVPIALYLRTTIRAHAVLVLYLIRAPGTYTCFVAGRMYRAKYRLGFGLVLRVKVIATLVFLVGRKIDRCRLFFYKIAIRRLETFLP